MIPYIIVDRAVQPWELRRPGLYVASSETAGYGSLLAAATMGVVERVGDHAMPGPREAIAVLRRHPRHRNPEIGISAAWYQRILNDYRDWREGWWREAIQNAVDAGATEIVCEAVEQPDGTWTVSAEDNGSGMSPEVLVDKFLQMGGTTKVVGATGGFGAAKELLILPWLRWSVHTGSIIAEGAANQYELRDAPPRKGVRLEVTMPGDQYTDAAPAAAFVEKCYLPRIKVRCITRTQQRDEPITLTPKGRLRAVDLLEEIPGKASIYVAKVDYRSHYLYVRANGLYMFSQYVGETKGRQLLCELQVPSVEALTKNRDGFRDQALSRAVGNLGERVAKDVRTALRSKVGMIRQKYEGVGKFEIQRRQAEVLQRIGPIEPELDRVSLEDSAVEAMSGATSRPAIGRILLGSVDYKGPTHVENAVQQLVWEPDFFLVNDIEGFRVPAKFKPASMKPRVLKLVSVWTELCRFVLMQLGSAERFGVGLIFSQDAGAAYQPDDGEHWLMLNPYRDVYERKAIWQPTKIEDRKWLYAAAVHECTHLADGLEYHDESFAAALTRNIARTADGFRKVGAIVRSIRTGTLPPLRARPQSNPVGASRRQIELTKRSLMDWC